jgi:hypothetical protein
MRLTVSACRSQLEVFAKTCLAARPIKECQPHCKKNGPCRRTQPAPRKISFGARRARFLKERRSDDLT